MTVSSGLERRPEMNMIHIGRTDERTDLAPTAVIKAAYAKCVSLLYAEVDGGSRRKTRNLFSAALLLPSTKQKSRSQDSILILRVGV